MFRDKPVFLVIAAVIVVLVLSVVVTAALNFNSISSAFKPASDSVSVPVSSSSAIESSSSSSSESSSSAVSASSAASASSKPQAASSGSIKGLKIIAYVNGEPLYNAYPVFCKSGGLVIDSDSDGYNTAVRLMVLSQEAKKEKVAVDLKSVSAAADKIKNYAQEKDVNKRAQYKQTYDTNNAIAKACGLSFNDYINKVFIPVTQDFTSSISLQSKFYAKYKNISYDKVTPKWNAYADGLFKKAVIKKVA